VIGMAASAASVIAMAGDHIKMSVGSMLMIHSAWGVVGGNQQDMRDFAAVLDRIDNSIAELYAARTGIPKNDVLAMMREETWFSADEAVSRGFADIADKKTAKASMQLGSPAASGKKGVPVVLLGNTSSGLPGSAASFPRGILMKTAQERISGFEAKRAADVARMEVMMRLSDEQGRSFDQTEQQEYDGLVNEVQEIDGHIKRARDYEALMVAKAPAITPAIGADPAKAAAVRANSGIVAVYPNVEKGVKMARYALSLIRANGSLSDALNLVRNNRQWMDQTPELERVMMAAVAAGDTTTSGWASELVYAQNVANEFIDYLRPMTLLGRIQGFRRVPFNIRVGSQTAGGTGYWVGQGAPIPLSKPTTGSTTLGIAKAAGLMAIDDELRRSSSPSAELMVRDDLAKTVQQLLDLSLIDPNQGGTANVQPASLTYNVTPITPTGTNAAAISTDVAAVFAAAIAANLDPMNAVWIMTPTTALKLSLMLTSLGSKQYPDITIKGGTWQGLPVVVSNIASISGSPDYANMIVLMFPDEVLLADEGQVTIEASNEASIQMLDNPTNTSTGGTTATTMVSMFQTHSLAIKAVRYINWAKRRTTAVAFIRTAAYA
jgi:HK97 family phage major capsid protein